MNKDFISLLFILLTACALPMPDSAPQMKTATSETVTKNAIASTAASAVLSQPQVSENMPNLQNLISDDPAWPLVREWVATASNRVEVLPASDPDRSRALAEIRVTTRSPMGAVVYETGGILIDGGWLRIFGSGHPRLPRTLPKWNKELTWKDENASPPLLIIADDVIGGSFAINGGALNGPLRQVYYFAPDSLEWESLKMGYSEFLQWAFKGDVAGFYEGQRWSGWVEDVAALPSDKGFLIYPFLWAKGPPAAERSRKAVPIKEIVELQFDFQRQLSSEGK